MITIDNDFKTNASRKRIEYLQKTKDIIAINKNKWLAIIKDQFSDGCEQIRKLQSESEFPAIASLEYLMLYTNFINRRYVAELFACGDELYLDKVQRHLGSCDISELFVFYDRLWEDLLALRKRYVGKVSTQDINEFMLQSLPEFYSFLEGIIRIVVTDLADKNPFTNIIKCEKFLVNVGDYMSSTHTVYTEWKSRDELAKKLSDNPDNVEILGDYSGLDFSDKDLSQLDLRYVQFRGSTLKDTNLYSSLLTGANFRNANMEGCYIEECSISEADFSHANLKNASFMFSGPEESIDEEEQSYSKLLPPRFHCADLTDADLNGANLAGADFTGANLTRTDFTGGNITGADFTGADLTDTVFTDVITNS